MILRSLGVGSLTLTSAAEWISQLGEDADLG